MSENTIKKMTNQELADDVLTQLIEYVNASDELEFDYDVEEPSDFLGSSVYQIDELCAKEPLELKDYIFDTNDLGRSEGDGQYQDWVYEVQDKNTGEQFYLMFTGWYSSWDSSEAEAYCIGEAYEFKEIRYQPRGE